MLRYLRQPHLDTDKDQHEKHHTIKLVSNLNKPFKRRVLPQTTKASKRTNLFQKPVDEIEDD